MCGGFICRHDVIAQMCHARRLAQRLYPVARMVDLHGGHLVSHERTEEVLFCPIYSCLNFSVSLASDVLQKT